MSKYEWEEGMGEISGFGGSYEQACRVLVRVGCDWMAAHPEADPGFKGYEGVYGVLTPGNDDAKALLRAMEQGLDAAGPNGGMTGAMHQATTMAILWIKKYGWEAYAKKMREAEKEHQERKNAENAQWQAELDAVFHKLDSFGVTPEQAAEGVRRARESMKKKGA